MQKHRVVRRPPRPLAWPTRTLALVVTLTSFGCSGSIGGSEGEGPLAPNGKAGVVGAAGAPGGGVVPSGPAPPPGGSGNAAQAPMGTRTGGRPVVRLLSRQELDNAVEDLFGVTTTDAELPLADVALTGLASPATDFLGATDFEKIDRLTWNAATQFVAKVQAGAGKCPDGAGVPACVDVLLTAQGRRVFRRPLTTTELDSYKRLLMEL